MGLITLLNAERSFFLKNVRSTTVASFYEVDNTAADAINTIGSLRDRAVRILKANPWLCGRLVEKELAGRKDVCLSYDNEPDDTYNYVNIISSDDLFADKTYPSISRIIINYVPKKGTLCVDKDEPLCKFLIFQNSDVTELALVFSLHHMIGDGYTLYYLWKMLDEKEEVSPMVAERVHNFKDHLKRDTNIFFDQSLQAAVKCVLGCLLRGMGRWIRRRSLPHSNMYKVNLEAISRIKAKYNTPESFVSTNDVLNCIFFGDNGCQTDGIMMAINMRERIPEIHKNMVGNYQQGFSLRAPDVCNPQVFRKAWTGMLSKEQPPREALSFSEILNHGAMNISTSWTTDYYQVELTGFKHSLHVPVLTVPLYECIAGIPVIGECMMIIFKMNHDEIGVFTCVYNDLPQDHFDNCEVFCEKVLS